MTTAASAGPTRASDPADTSPLGGRRRMLVLIVVLTATFMQLVDVSIVNVAIPSIQRDLDAGYAQIQLVLVLYQLAFASVLITGARLGDLYGRRRAFLVGMGGFTLASLVAGAAVSPTMLIGARFVQGLTCGIMFPQVLSIIQVMFPPRERGRAFAVFGATIGLATILGPLLGGVLIYWDLFALGWRTIFLVNLPIGVTALVAAWFLLPESREPQAKRLDLPGVVIVVVGLLLLIYPIVQGRQLGWPWWVFAMVATSVPVLLAFAAYQQRRTRSGRSPLVVMTLFADPAFRVGLVLSLVFFAGVPAFFFSFAIYLQIGQGFSALATGLAGVSFAVGSGVASALSDRVARRLGKRVLAVGALLLAVGMVLILLTVRWVGEGPHIYDFTLPFLVAGIGLGLFLAPMVNIILAGIRSEAAGSASGVLATGQQVGGALGIALIGVILFGSLGALAPSVVDEVSPQLRTSLATAGVPPAAVDRVTGQFRACFVDRANQSDPTAVPPSCRAAREAAGTVAQRHPEAAATVRSLLGEDGTVPTTALALDFSHAYQRALLYEFGIFVLAFLVVVFAVPSVDPHQIGQAPPAEA